MGKKPELSKELKRSSDKAQKRYVKAYAKALDKHGDEKKAEQAKHKEYDQKRWRKLVAARKGRAPEGGQLYSPALMQPDGSQGAAPQAEPSHDGVLMSLEPFQVWRHAESPQSVPARPVEGPDLRLVSAMHHDDGSAYHTFSLGHATSDIRHGDA